MVLRADVASCRRPWFAGCGQPGFRTLYCGFTTGLGGSSGVHFLGSACRPVFTATTWHRFGGYTAYVAWGSRAHPSCSIWRVRRSIRHGQRGCTDLGISAWRAGLCLPGGFARSTWRAWYSSFAMDDPGVALASRIAARGGPNGEACMGILTYILGVCLYSGGRTPYSLHEPDRSNGYLSREGQGRGLGRLCGGVCFSQCG